jgi:hypothetical protein
MNHAIKNISLKISSAPYGVKSPLDSNRQNISANSYPLRGAPLPAFPEN